MSPKHIVAQRLREAADEAARMAPNEASLRQHMEQALEAACHDLRIPWTPFRLEHTLRAPGEAAQYADVAHGGVVIEYEPPRSFKGGRAASRLAHARGQAEEYVRRLGVQEGRADADYVMVVWDGAHIAFGRPSGVAPEWDSLRPFDEIAAIELLDQMTDQGRPLVHPLLVDQLAGPSSAIGQELTPALFDAAVAAGVAHRSGRTTKTYLMLTEWRRLFSQVVGTAPSPRLAELLRLRGLVEQRDYEAHPAEYLFALNSYLALVVKATAALALPGSSQDIGDPMASIDRRVRALEDGTLFADAGVTNFLVGDYFGWLTDDDRWSGLAPVVARVVDSLATVNFDVTKKSARSVRDLFKGLYESFIPRALRHALGEFYTPDWMAAYALDALDWPVDASLTDPTCGTGTFLLEALRRRREAHPTADAGRLLRGLGGLDLNPVAVLAARASLVIALADKLSPTDPVTLPVFLADALNPAVEESGTFVHTIQTEVGDICFRVPAALVRSASFLPALLRLRDLTVAGLGPSRVVEVLDAEGLLSALDDDGEDLAEVRELAEVIGGLHGQRWDGIWAAVLADRFAAGALPPADFLVGNPPWVKWSNLPRDYAALVKPRLAQLGLQSDASYVGGIESDIATVVIFEAVERWLQCGGRMAMFVTATVFETPSGQGFRRFSVGAEETPLGVERVEDFTAIAPFDGVSNRPALMVAEKGRRTEFPVPFWSWSWPQGARGRFDAWRASPSEFRHLAVRQALNAEPVPGTDSGPWLRGTIDELSMWKRVLRGSGGSYVGRNGVTTDRNGVFYVQVRDIAEGRASVTNDPRVGRTRGLPAVSSDVEAKHLFPLLKGSGIKAWFATLEQDHRILVPQRSMNGDPDLPVTAPLAYRFLSQFEETLRTRGSLRRYQPRKPYWSLWTVGAYTFAPYKVVWKELGGNATFRAALVRPFDDPILGEARPVVPNNKVYFVAFDDVREAAFVCGVLNARSVASAITAYAARLSLGTSPTEYVAVPRFTTSNTDHQRIADIALDLSARRAEPTDSELDELDEIVLRQVSAPSADT